TFISDYVNWLKQEYSFNKLDQADEVITPFVNHINDRIRIYLQYMSNDKIRISDDGNTINELEMLGIDLNTKVRTKLIENVLNNFSVNLENDILFIDSDPSNFPTNKHKLIQTILRVYDLTMTQKKNIINLFNEEVQEFLFDHDFAGNVGAKYTGGSGIDYQIDYSLGPTKKRPEIFIQFINNFNFNSITTESFIYDDLKEARSSDKTKFSYKIIANDDEQKLSTKALTAARAKNIDVIPWSDKKTILSLK
ncbi:DUF1828 domain-containing protein, partial [Enterococcus faecalis]|nr:DUF1828 domain-containing protein [Enterococcus faecalis]